MVVENKDPDLLQTQLLYVGLVFLTNGDKRTVESIVMQPDSDAM